MLSNLQLLKGSIIAFFTENSLLIFPYLLCIDKRVNVATNRVNGAKSTRHEETEKSLCRRILEQCQLFLAVTSKQSTINNVSVNSKPDHPLPPGDSRRFARSHCSGVVFSPNFLCPGLGVLNWRNFYSFERKMQELLDLFQRNRRQLEKQVFLCCFTSVFLQKQ